MRVAAAMLCGIAVTSCHIEEPFSRNNLWDPGADVTMTLSGPDSTFSVGETFSVDLTGDPPLPPGQLQIEWTGVNDTATKVLPSGYGQFTVTLAHAQFQRVAVAAVFDDVIVAVTLVVGQSVAALGLYCGASPLVPCDASPMPVGTTRVIRSDMRDANGNVLRRRIYAMRRAVIVSRDPGVLAIEPNAPTVEDNWTVRAVGPGSTWVVVRADRALDSVRVVVAP